MSGRRPTQARGCQQPERAAPPLGEVHIAGVLVHIRPPYLPDVRVAVSLLPHAEVTHATDDGRLVAVLEAESARGVMQQVDAIRALRGVVNVALVYQHAEPEEDMSKEIEG